MTTGNGQRCGGRPPPSRESQPDRRPPCASRRITRIHGWSQAWLAPSARGWPHSSRSIPQRRPRSRRPACERLPTSPSARTPRQRCRPAIAELAAGMGVAVTSGLFRGDADACSVRSPSAGLASAPAARCMARNEPLRQIEAAELNRPSMKARPQQPSDPARTTKPVKASSSEPSGSSPRQLRAKSLAHRRRNPRSSPPAMVAASTGAARTDRSDKDTTRAPRTIPRPVTASAFPVERRRNCAPSRQSECGQDQAMITSVPIITKKLPQRRLDRRGRGPSR